ncbi:MAG: flippase-like domain-containing protein [Gammaproteobacteria bacterium]|nr:flippase-like domain-containing protein [Gammaproteobacteria bacterium]
MTEVNNNSTKQSGSRHWVIFAKLAFGIALMAALIMRVDLSALLHKIAGVDIFYLTLMFIIPHLMIGINTLKWQIFLRELGLRLNFNRLFGLYLIATFFNNFLPTMVGGDAVRAYALGRDTQDASSVTAATFMERLVGLAGLVSLVPLVLFSTIVTDQFPVVWLLAPASLLGFALASAMLLSSKFDPLWRWLRNIKKLARLLEFLGRTRKAVYRAAQSLRILLTTYLLSLLFYVGAAGAVWAAAMSLGANVSIGYLIATVPLVLVAGMLPVSLNGLGITEAGFALFLQLAGVPLVDAIGVGLLLRARLLVTGLFGGLLFLRYRSANTDVPAAAER